MGDSFNQILQAGLVNEKKKKDAKAKEKRVEKKVAVVAGQGEARIKGEEFKRKRRQAGTREKAPPSTGVRILTSNLGDTTAASTGAATLGGI